MVRAAALLEARITRALRPHGLSPAAYSAPAVLRSHADPDGASPGVLAEHRPFTSGGITNLVARLLAALEPACGGAAGAPVETGRDDR